MVQGYVQRSWNDVTGAPRTTAGGDRAPREVLRDDRPVLDLSGDRPNAAAMPDRTVALTFDDGPDPRWTPRILEVLRRHRARATFFVLGSKVAAHPALARRIVAEGHEVGSHTYTHVDLARTPTWQRGLELGLTQKALAGSLGLHTHLLRPPYSAKPTELTGADYAAARDAGRAGYLVVLADRDTKDWSGLTEGQIVARATPSGQRGAIVLMHDGGGDRSRTVAALDTLLTRLDERGYRVTTVSDALHLRHTAVPVSLPERIAGGTVVAAQQAGRIAAVGLTYALAAAGVLTVGRVVILAAIARLHVGRARRNRRRPPANEPEWYYPPVSVVVPAYNEAAGIAATVGSLVRTTYPGPVEVVVVDDGSTDDTARIARELDLPGVTVLSQANAGKPAALNTGIAYARHEILVLVDGDTVFQPDTIAHLVAAFANPTVGAVSGNTKVGNTGGILGRWQQIEYVVGFNLDRRMYDVLECMPTVPGAIGAFRRQALADAADPAGPGSTYAMTGPVSVDTLAEDTDLTMAVCRAGWRVVYEETAVAWTEAPSSLRQLWRQRYRWCYGTLQSMWKHRRALVERGPSGRFGRRALPYLAVFQVALPLLAPAVDVFALYGLFFGEAVRVVGVWAAFVAVQALVGAYALRLDGERLTPLWTLPLQQFVYRQLMYLVVIQSVVTAVAGAPLRWHAMRREGTFARRDPASAV
nr:bifunctional polysaccharide deacetylase/glycosyltransferase family 2 protein [Actinopolymorpha cephalotaxi]